VTRMWWACKRWNETVNTNNKIFDKQIYSYGNKTLVPIAKRLSKEFNIKPSLDPRLLPAIFTYCQFYVVHFDRTDTWCKLLSPKELLLLRYYYEMGRYYKYSYGHPLNERLSCSYYTQFVKGVEDYLSGKTSMIADLKNAHGFSLLFMLTSLVCENFHFHMGFFFLALL
jgi:hypothetical protein